MSVWWSWALATAGLAGIWLTIRKRPEGWLVGVAAQALWLAYAAATGQWGFIATALAYGTLYARGWWRWRAEDNTPARDTADG